MNETCDYIENFFDLSEVKEPNRVFNIRNSPRGKNKQDFHVKTEAVDYFDPENAAVILDESSREEIINRNTTRKYLNIRFFNFIINKGFGNVLIMLK